MAAELIPVRSLKIIFFQRDPNSILFRQLTGNGSKNYDVPNPRYMKHGIINGNEGFKTLLKINLMVPYHCNFPSIVLQDLWSLFDWEV